MSTIINEYIGCLHIHINPGTKRQTLESIFHDARKSGLDFLILTPHTPSKRKWNDYFSLDGYRNNVLVLAGEEADERSRLNHILIYGNRSWLGKQPVEKIVSCQRKDSLLMFAAHPDGKHRLFGFPVDHRWTKKQLFDSINGLEVWSALFDFARDTNPSNLVFRYFSFPRNFRGPTASTLRLWDTLVKKRKFVGVCGLDIHPLPRIMKHLDLKKTFGFDFVFKTLRNHILTTDKMTGDSENDRNLVVNAFKQGKIFFANDFIADSRGFFFGSHDKKKTIGDVLYPGEEILVELPEKSHVNVRINSEKIYSGDTKRLILKTGVCGACRVEAFYKGRAWIFSNPVFIVQNTEDLKQE